MSLPVAKETRMSQTKSVATSVSSSRRAGLIQEFIAAGPAPKARQA